MSLSAGALKRISRGGLFRQWLDNSSFATDIIPVMVAVVVGLVTGLATSGFIWLIALFTENAQELRDEFGVVAGIGLMIAAGFITGLIIRYIAPEVQGGGVPSVMEAIALRRGYVRRRVAPTKIVTSAITIGVGGSVGREGPIVQIGGSIGSTIGRLVKLSDEDVGMLVAAGAAGGISAAFNTPIAGAMFALEVILGNFNRRNLKAVIVAAVAANVVSRPLLGEAPAFRVPTYPLDSPLEIPVYILLGFLCAIGAITFIKLLYFGEHFFEHWDVSLPIRTAVGMGLTGIVALFLPEILGSGLEFIGEAIADNIDLGAGVIISLFFLKMIATIFTLGSGNSGGDLAPTLFLGAAIGSLVGRVFHDFAPDIAVNPGAFALVGMAAMFAGAARAPITAILLVFEMSNDYRLIVPLMLSVAVSTLLSDIILKDSIYTLKLTLRGIRLQQGQDIDLLQSVSVADVMSKNYEPISPSTTLAEMLQKLHSSHHHGFPIVDKHGIMRGIVTLTDVERAQRDEMPYDTPVTEIGTTHNVYVAYPDDPIYLPLRRMNVYGIGRLPVIERGTEKYLGMIRRQDILKAYDIGLMRKSIEVDRTQRFKLRNIDKASFIEVEVGPNAPMVGVTLREFPCSDKCLILSIRRQGENIIAHGDTRIEAGDLIVAYTEQGADEIVLTQFT